MKFHAPLTQRVFSAAFAILLLSLFSSIAAFADPAIPAGSIRIHYFRPDGNYTGWTVYAFDNTTENTGNYGGGPVQVTGTDSFGVYFDVGVTTGAQEVGIIIHNPTALGGDQKDTPNNLFVDPSTHQCGWLTDKFGVSWQIVPNLVPQIMQSGDAAAIERVMRAVMPMKKLDMAKLQLAFDAK